MARTLTPKLLFAGLDLSLTASGVVILDSAGGLVARHVVKPTTRGVQRLKDIQIAFRKIISSHAISHAYIEGYAMGVDPMASLKIAEAGGVIRVLLHDAQIPFIDTIKPSQVKKFATGAGGGAAGSKDQVTMFVYKDWGFQAADNNEADAYVLARIGMALHGYGELDKTKKEVISAIQNPPVKTKKKKTED